MLLSTALGLNVNELNVKGSNYLCFGGGVCVCVSKLRIGKRLRDDLLRDTVAEVIINTYLYNIHSLRIPEVLDS